MFVFGGNNSGIRDDYKINNSLRFRSNASAASTAYLTRTPASNTNRTTWTWSAWVKRAFLSSSGETTLFGAAINSGDRILISFYQDKLLMYAVSGGVASTVSSAAVYRDPSAWYHVVVAMDTTQATASNRSRLYINGTEITSFATSTRPNQNQTFAINSTNQHQIGRNFDGTSQVNFMDGYLAEVNFIDGQALTPSDFGYTHPKTGVWRPKPYTGTYGTNGFYLKFSDIATTSGSNAGLGKDFSGNGNYWTTNNISVTSGTTYDAMTDSPTLGASASNYAVLNPLQAYTGVVGSGNLKATGVSGNNYINTPSTFWISSGKWYWEATITSQNVITFVGIGDAGVTYQTTGGSTWLGTTSGGYAYRGDNGQKGNNNSFTTYGATFTTGDIIGVAFDATTGTLTFYKNNVSQGTAFTGISGTFTPVVTTYSTGIIDINFGQRPFTYTPPTGYKALNTYNLPNVTIPKGNKVMDATTYTGTGATQSITNAASFKPDFVWIKDRTAANSNMLYDSVRGIYNALVSNATQAEVSLNTSLTAFNSNGFSIGNYANVNTNTNALIAWQWQAGQGTTSSNTQGSITSTVSVNATAGFSVVTYTGNGITSGATVGHGLGVSPKFIILKDRSSTQAWRVYHASLAAGTSFGDITTSAANTTTVFTNGGLGTPTSSVINFVNGTTTINAVNGNGDNYVAYCWAEIAGFSKFGSYTGNASTDGPFVYLGFRPKFLMVKCSSAVGNWFMMDSMRDTSNVATRRLFANLSNAEDTSGLVDFTSNGFKLRMSTALNDSATYIYMAFAENPFKYSLAR